MTRSTVRQPAACLASSRRFCTAQIRNNVDRLTPYSGFPCSVTSAYRWLRNNAACLETDRFTGQRKKIRYFCNFLIDQSACHHTTLPCGIEKKKTENISLCFFYYGMRKSRLFIFAKIFSQYYCSL